MKDQYYAHSVEGRPPEEWHRLEYHLKKVAEMPRTFANDFSAGDWGYLAGLWHDLGKYSDDPQIHSAECCKKNGRGWNKKVIYEVLCAFGK